MAQHYYYLQAQVKQNAQKVEAQLKSQEQQAMHHFKQQASQQAAAAQNSVQKANAALTQEKQAAQHYYYLETQAKKNAETAEAQMRSQEQQVWQKARQESASGETSVQKASAALAQEKEEA